MNNSPEVTVAICCYNAAKYLPLLLDQLVMQSCPFAWEILIIDNNSDDNSNAIITQFATTSHIPIRTVLEPSQGIPHARNRAIIESKKSTFLAFIDADELPAKNWLMAAINCLNAHSADCVGGEIELDLSYCPAWLSNNLLPFLGQVNHRDHSFQIVDRNTPIWSGNIAFRLSLFNQGLRFDTRYNREGKGIGGGEDGILFRHLLASDNRIFYEPEMRITHLIPEAKLTRSYFLKLHYIAGKKVGLYELAIDKNRSIFGVPRYMFFLFGKKTIHALMLFIIQHKNHMREAMNATHLLGQIIGLSQLRTGTSIND